MSNCQRKVFWATSLPSAANVVWPILSDLQLLDLPPVPDPDFDDVYIVMPSPELGFDGFVMLCRMTGSFRKEMRRRNARGLLAKFLS